MGTFTLSVHSLEERRLIFKLRRTAYASDQERQEPPPRLYTHPRWRFRTHVCMSTAIFVMLKKKIKINIVVCLRPRLPYHITNDSD